jgi:uncharacterized protein YlaI
VGYTIDYLVGELRCAFCDTVSVADERTNMTTRLRDEPELAFLGVGDKLPVDTERALKADYLLVREPAPGETVVLLHLWTCPSCGGAWNWAEVAVRDGVIESVHEVLLNQETLARVNFVVEDVRDVAADLAGSSSPLSLDDEGVVAVLRERLPVGRGWTPGEG